jgi:hypothetical protein
MKAYVAPAHRAAAHRSASHLGSTSKSGGRLDGLRFSIYREPEGVR